MTNQYSKTSSATRAVKPTAQSDTLAGVRIAEEKVDIVQNNSNPTLFIQLFHTIQLKGNAAIVIWSA